MYQLPGRGAKPAWLIPALSSLVFLLTGLALLPYPGLQNDELFFSGPIYNPDAAYYRIEFGATKIPLMVMSYTGALKTWLYAGLFQFVAPTVWSVRVPMLLLGALTIWLTWCWVRRIAGVRAAAIAVTLLSTDTIFLLTNNFDWGPVALQHVLLMGGLLAVQIWLGASSIQSFSTQWMLALGFFLWGLGMWDKALLIWPLIGLAVASVCVFRRELTTRLRPLAVTIAAVSFLAGASPLVLYNIAQRGATAAENANFATEAIAHKAEVLRNSIAGYALYDYMAREKAGNYPRAPQNRLERTAAWLAGHLGDHRSNWMLPACMLAILCFTGLWGSQAWRPLLFLLIVVAVEWVQMAFTKGAGGGSHHVVLMWPFPFAFIGIAYSAMARRMPRMGPPLLAIVILLLIVGNLLTTNRYLFMFARNGASTGWTDAIDPLARSLEHEAQGRSFGLVDWGYLNQLQLLDEGDLHLFVADQEGILANIGLRGRAFIRHTEDQQMFPGVNERFRKTVQDLGYTEKVEQVVRDRNGRPVFEVFHVVKMAP